MGKPASAASRGASIIEALAIFVLIMVYIWELRFRHPYFWILPVALILISHVARHERGSELGFRSANLGICLRRFGPAPVALTVLMWSAGWWFKTIRPIGFQQAMLSFALYLPWGLFQQYLLNGYFLRRFDAALSPRGAALLASFLFGVVHSPNWFLMAVTPLGALAAIGVYRRYRNLYFLGLAHGVIGILLFLTLPDSLSHHLNVGPPRQERVRSR